VQQWPTRCRKCLFEQFLSAPPRNRDGKEQHAHSRCLLRSSSAKWSGAAVVVIAAVLFVKALSDTGRGKRERERVEDAEVPRSGRVRHTLRSQNAEGVIQWRRTVERSRHSRTAETSGLAGRKVVSGIEKTLDSLGLGEGTQRDVASDTSKLPPVVPALPIVTNLAWSELKVMIMSESPPHERRQCWRCVARERR
jgi:hypothetical protein